MEPFCVETVLEDLHMDRNILAQDKLDSNRDEWRRIFEAIGHPTIIVDAQHNVRAANRATLVATGKSQEQLQHLKCYEIFHGTDRPPQDCPLQRMLETGRLETLEMELEALGGVYLVSCTPVLDDNGHLKEAIHIATDITEHKKAIDTLRQSEERFRALAESTSDWIWEVDQNGAYTYASPKIEDLLGYEPTEVLGKTPFDLMPADEAKRIEGDLRHRLTSGEPFSRFEKTCLHKDGRFAVLETSGVPIVDGDGNLLGYRGVDRDITDRKRAVEELKERERTLRSIFRAAPVGIGLVIDRVLKEVNDRICEMVGRSRDELVEKSARIVYPTEEDFERVGREKYRQIHEHGTGTVETRWQHKNGQLIDVLLSSTPLDPDDLSAGVTFTALDISDRKRAEEALRQSEQRLQLTLEAAQLGMWDFNPTTFTDTHYNQRWFTMLGYSPDELPHSSDTWLQLIHPDDLEQTRQLLDNHLKGEADYLAEFRLKGKNGQYQWIQSVGRVVAWDQNGTPERMIGIHIDIAGRKEAEKERKRIEAELRQAQKMEAIGTLAGGIAHDFNNILGAIWGYAELAAMDTPDDLPVKNNLQQVLKACRRARDLVQQILTFSRQTEQEERPIKLGPIIEESLKLLRASIPATIEVRQTIDKDSGTVVIDPSQAHQVLMNLCTNAAHAMRETGGILEVGLTNMDIDAEQAAQGRDFEPGPYVRLTVSDTGHGIETHLMSRIFDPYFTTKEKGVGTGLGLSVVHGIVKGHGGTVSVSSTPGKRTTFHVYLPRLEARAAREARPAETLPTGNERILLVDDEETLVQIGRQMLERLGYRVVAQTSPIEASEVFHANPDGFDLVITDQTMPNMTGDRLAKQLMAVKPEIPIILCSGFSEMTNEKKAKAMGIRAYVMKPLVMSDLAQTIRKVLEAD
jgi:PAS domain S-box-containing protein